MVDVCASELERSITRSLSAGSISSIRNDLFSEARESGLTTAGDALVARRKTNGGKTVKGKHASDKSKTALPRTLLRNGKRSRDEFTASQALHQVIPRPTVKEEDRKVETFCVYTVQFFASIPSRLWTTPPTMFH